MNYKEIHPSPLLADFVKCFWIAESDKDISATPTHGVIPGGYLDLVYNAGNRVVASDTFTTLAESRESFLIGPFDSFRRFHAQGRFIFFGARFHLGKSPLSPHIPLAEARNQAIPLCSLFTQLNSKTVVSTLESDLAHASGTNERFALLETFLLKFLDHHLAQDAVVNQAVKMIEESYGLTQVERLAAAIGISVRHLERKFAVYVGLSPKTFCRITRFRHVKSMIERVYGPNSCDLAYQCGYYDQTQLIREFRLFAGHTPLRYKAVKPVGFFLYDPQTHC